VAAIGTAMHIADYVAVGFLIASMLLAAAKVLPNPFLWKIRHLLKLQNNHRFVDACNID
jgi:hypothetical protein